MKLFRIFKRFNHPRPIRLENIKDQKEFEDLIKKFNENQQEKHPDFIEVKTVEGEKLQVKEVDGPAGPEPTRFGDWEKNGRVYDF
jgi:hypothetical protein